MADTDLANERDSRHHLEEHQVAATDLTNERHSRH